MRNLELDVKLELDFVFRIAAFRAHPESNIAYGCGAGIGRMLDTFQPSAVFTTTWFIRKRVG